MCTAKECHFFPCQGVLFQSSSCQRLDKENLFLCTAANESLTSVQEQVYNKYFYANCPKCQFFSYIDGWPSHHFVQLDGNFMLEAGNRHFLIVQALVNKTICVTTSDFCFIAKNLRIFKFCLLNNYDRKKCKISCSLIRKINYTTRKSVKNYI